MNRVRALLIDLDGTLADTAAANFRAYASALAEVGVSVSRAQFDAVARGLQWRQFLPELLSKAGVVAEPAMIAKRKAEIYATKVSDVVINEALVRLIEVSRPPCRTALVTTASSSAVNTIVARFDLLRLFDVIVTGDEVTHHKPNPEAYNVAAARLGVTPQECVVIEDSEAGVESALEFGASVLRIRIV